MVSSSYNQGLEILCPVTRLLELLTSVNRSLKKSKPHAMKGPTSPGNSIRFSNRFRQRTNTV